MTGYTEPFSGPVYWEVVQTFLVIFTMFLIMEMCHYWKHIFRHVGRVVKSDC
jgi:sterol desaturase/sphingolipid hydroxylase (fatty acid hydroxylase superfamily)